MSRLLIVGHGRMGRLVEQHAASAGFEVTGVVDADGNENGRAIDRAARAGVDVAIDFTTADAVIANVTALAECGVNLVIGTTGWGALEPQVRAIVEGAGIGVVASANFSLGANLLAALSERAAALFAGADGYGAFVYEQHHAAKRDAPSGTALLLRDALQQGGWAAPIDVAATRAGFIPGTHVVGFDGPAETVTLTHAVRDGTL